MHDLTCKPWLFLEEIFKKYNLRLFDQLAGPVPYYQFPNFGSLSGIFLFKFYSAIVCGSDFVKLQHTMSLIFMVFRDFIIIIE